MEKVETVSIGVRLPADLVDSLKKMAAAEQRTFSNMIKVALTDYVEKAKDNEH